MMEECESFDLALNLFRSRSVPSEGKLAPTSVGRLLPMRWRMAAIKTVKRVGAIMQPCLTPVSTLKASVSEPLQRTALLTCCHGRVSGSGYTFLGIHTWIGLSRGFGG